MNNLEKVAELLQNDPQLQEKINEEAKRVAEKGEASGLVEAVDMAINNILGIDLTDEEIQVLIEEANS